MSQAACSRCRRTAGFTLIELMVALVVVSILAMVALPSYLGSVRKGRRAEAIGAITKVQQLQERWRSNKASYAASLTNAEAGTPPGLAMSSARTTNGYYDLALSGTGVAGYTLTATAVAGSSQDKDTPCKVMAMQLAGGNLQYGGGETSSINWASPDPNRCWAK